MAVPSGRWKTVKTNGDTPSKRSAHSSVVYNDQMYTFGGFDNNSELNDLYSFSALSHRWTLIPPKEIAPCPRRYHSAVVHSDAMYIFGGCSQHQLLSDLYYFDFVEGAWVKVEDYGKRPPPRFGHCAIVYKGRMYIYGGYGDDNTTEIHYFDFDTNNWHKVRTTGTPPSPRVYASAVLFKDHMYVFGGKAQGSESMTFLNDLYSFNFDTRVWKKIEGNSSNGAGSQNSKGVADMDPQSDSVPSRRAGHTALLYGTGMLVFGGSDKKRYYNDMFRFGIDSQEWCEMELAGSAPKKRSGHSAVVIDNQMVVFGGLNFNDVCILTLDRVVQVEGSDTETRRAEDKISMKQKLKETEARLKEAEERLAAKVKEEERLRKKLDNLEGKYDELRAQTKLAKAENPEGADSKKTSSATPRTIPSSNSSNSLRSGGSSATPPAGVAASLSSDFDETSGEPLELVPADLEITWNEENLVGKGKETVVYRGAWKGIDCAIKKIDHKALLRLATSAVMQEAAVMKLVGSHPGCITVYGTCKGPGGEICIVEEIALYRSVWDTMRRTNIEGGNPRMLDLVEMALDAAKGLRYLHVQKVTHGRINAKNVLITARWKAVLADFALTSSITNQATSSFNAKVEEDIRQFGLFLQETFTKPAKPGSGGPSTSSTPELVSGCPSTMARLIAGCLATSKSDRLSLRSICEHLRACRQELYPESGGELPVSLSSLPKPWRTLFNEMGLTGSHYNLNPDRVAFIIHTIGQETGLGFIQPTPNGSIYLPTITDSEASKMADALRSHAKARQQLAAAWPKLGKLAFKDRNARVVRNDSSSKVSSERPKSPTGSSSRPRSPPTNGKKG